jgi:hypothetical protein
LRQTPPGAPHFDIRQTGAAGWKARGPADMPIQYFAKRTQSLSQAIDFQTVRFEGTGAARGLSTGSQPDISARLQGSRKARQGMAEVEWMWRGFNRMGILDAL